MFAGLDWDEIRKQAARASRTWAPPRAGLPKLQEECGEVIAAVNQFGYGRLSPGGLAEELADNQLMLVQAAQLVGEDLFRAAVAMKLERLTRRLDQERDWSGREGDLEPGAQQVSLVQSLVDCEPSDAFLEELFRDFRPELDVKEWRRRLYSRCVGHYLEHRP